MSDWRLRLSQLSPSYWLVQVADRSTGDPEITAAMREELDIQVTTGLSRAELRNQYGILAITFLVPMAVVAVAMWILSATSGVGPAARFVGVTLIAFCGGSAVWGAFRWLASPGDDKKVVWHPWLVDSVVLVLAVVAATLPTT